MKVKTASLLIPLAGFTVFAALAQPGDTPDASFKKPWPRPGSRPGGPGDARPEGRGKRPGGPPSPR